MNKQELQAQELQADADHFGTACDLCGAEMDRETCWDCGGAGGFHDCGEDCCCCLYPEDDLNRTCEECGGQGSYWQCPNAPHDAVKGGG